MQATATWRERVEQVAAVVRRVIGVPDYDRYATHMAACHPGEPLMSREEFLQDRWKEKYTRPGSRCC